MTRPYGSSARWLWQAVLAATLAGAAARGRAVAVEAALAVDPAVAVVGQAIAVTLTITNTGVLLFEGAVASLSLTSGSDLVTITSGPSPSNSRYVSPGAAQAWVWTLSVTGTGTIHLTGQANGYIASQPYSAESSAILVIPSPSPPAIRILNNVLRPGKTATIVLHGSALGTVTLVAFDRSGAPLGTIGRPVVLDGNGFGSARFDGTVQGRRLSTGMYWIVASGAASAKAPVLVRNR